MRRGDGRVEEAGRGERSKEGRMKKKVEERRTGGKDEKGGRK